MSAVVKNLPNDLQKKVTHLPSVDLYIVEVDPRTLNENPKNWRVHTRRQRDTYKAFKSKHGWLAFTIYNLKTNRLLDGHMRVDEAIKNKESHVPVILKYISEEEENEILATFDNIGLLVKRNTEALKSLTESTRQTLSVASDKNSQKLKQLTQDLAELNQSVLLPQSQKKTRVKSLPQDESEGNEDEEENVFTPTDQGEIRTLTVNPDILFDGLTFLGIPELRSDRLLLPEEAPTETYAKDGYSRHKYFCISSGPFESGQPIGTLGFYTEDYKFEDAFSNPDIFAEYLEELDPTAIIGPDFSTYSDWPMVMRLWSLYRSRWCSRFWQELGYSVCPSLQSLGSSKFTSEYVLETLPQECPTLALQCRKSDLEGLIEYIKLVISVRTPETMILYGGQEKQKYLHGYLPTRQGKKKIHYIYLTQFTEKRRKLRKRT